MRISCFIFAILLLLAAPARAEEDPHSLPALKARAEHKDVDAQFMLGWRYHQGALAPRNDVEAAKWFTKAANAGHPDAQYYLGILYEYGDGVKSNYATARKWLTKSAEKDNGQAQAALGWLYVNGWGVKKDFKEACKWFMLASLSSKLPGAPVCNEVAGDLTAAQIAQARENAQNWRTAKKLPPMPKQQTED